MNWILSHLRSWGALKPVQSVTPIPHPSPVIPLKQRESESMQAMLDTRRNIRGLFVHSTATKASRKVTPADIYQWHVTENGWKYPGYHFLIQRDGTLLILRDINITGAHTYRHNTGTIGIVMAGGLSDKHGPQANFTRAQFRTLRKFTDAFSETYPDAFIKGHRDVANTACPSFNVQHWVKTGEVKA